nr:uncharacterized protein LOC128694793 [Cherax quadricarinatus]
MSEKLKDFDEIPMEVESSPDVIVGVLPDPLEVSMEIPQEVPMEVLSARYPEVTLPITPRVPSLRFPSPHAPIPWDMDFPSLRSHCFPVVTHVVVRPSIVSPGTEGWWPLLNGEPYVDLVVNHEIVLNLYPGLQLLHEGVDEAGGSVYVVSCVNAPPLLPLPGLPSFLYDMHPSP